MGDRGRLDPKDNGNADARAAIGRWIRDSREFLGISQHQLRRRLDAAGVPVSQSTLSRWESGETAPPAEVLPELARALGTSLDTFEEVVARARRATSVDLTGRSLDELRDDADRAARLGNFHHALALYEAALDRLQLMQEEDAAEEALLRAGLFLRLAWVHYNLWQLVQARRCLQLVTVPGGLPPALFLRRLLMQAALDHREGDDPTGNILVDRARALLDEEELEAGDRAWGLHSLGYYYFVTDRIEDAIEPLEAAAESWARLSNVAEAARAKAFLGHCVMRTRDPGRGEHLVREALEEAAPGRYGDVVIQAGWLLGWGLAECGRVTEGVPFLEDAMAAARRADLPEEEFVAAYHAWRFLAGPKRETVARRLRRLLARVHPLLPEARRFREAAAKDTDGKEAGR